MKQAILYTLLLLLLTSACAYGRTSGGAGCDTLVIISTNDVHAQIHNFPKLAAYVQGQRDSCSRVLVLSAGDLFSGNPEVDKYKERGYPMIELMNEVGYACSTLGNHDFDYGQAQLKKLSGEAHFPFLCANADFSHSELKDVAKPYVIKDVKGLKVAILGLIENSDDGHPSTLPENIEGISFSDGINVAKEYNYLRDSGNVFLVLSHLGCPEDRKLAMQLSDIDVIVGGHTHTVLPDGEDAGGVLITQTGANLYNVGKTVLLLKDGKVISRKSILIPLDSLTAIDTVLQSQVAVYENDPKMKEVVGHAAADFTGKYALGNLITDAMAAVHHFDIAVANNGGLRIKTLPAGEITYRQVYKLDPFENQLYEYNLSIEELKAFLKLVYNTKKEDMLQISGAGYTVMLSAKDTAKADDIVITDYNGRALKAKGTYKVGMSSYVKGRFMHLTPHKDQGKRIKVTTAESLLVYLKRQDPVVPQPPRVVEKKGNE